MNSVENESIKQQIYFERYKNNEAEKIIKLLKESVKEIKNFITQTADISTKKRYKIISKKVKEVASQLKNSVYSNLNIEEIIDYELKKQNKILSKLINSKFGDLNIELLYPTVEQIKTAALFKPVLSNMTFESFLESIEKGFYNTWDSAVRSGYLTGVPTKTIVETVVGKVSSIDKLKHIGSLQPLINSVYSNTRTFLQSLAHETQMKVYAKNEKYFGDDVGNKYEYLSTLDSRTCLICGVNDGKKYKNINDLPQLPLHRGCRCIIVPYFEDNQTRSSQSGQIDSKIKFSEWLAEQNDEVLQDVLGKSRFNLYKKGYKIENFVDDGKIITVEELKNK